MSIIIGARAMSCFTINTCEVHIIDDSRNFVGRTQRNLESQQLKQRVLLISPLALSASSFQ